MSQGFFSNEVSLAASASSSSSCHERSIEVKCKCNFRASLLTSHTESNPGRRFFSCHFYNHLTGLKSCDFFQWYDREIVGRPREVINKLLYEKKKMKTDLSEMCKKIGQMEELTSRLECDNKLLRDENLQLKNDMQRMRRAPCCSSIVFIVIGMGFMYFFGMFSQE